jgi:hypothetical protein
MKRFIEGVDRGCCAKRGASSSCLRHTLHIPPCIQRRPPAPLIFWTALSERPGGLEFGCEGKPETDTWP